MAEVKATAAKPKTAKIKLPLSKYEKDDVYVAINGKSYLIKRGIEVQVPAAVVEVLENRERMLRMAYDFEEEAASKANDKELM